MTTMVYKLLGLRYFKAKWVHIHDELPYRITSGKANPSNVDFAR